MQNCFHNIDVLIDQWCQRRALKPLSILLPKYVTVLTSSDEKLALLEALRAVRGLCRKDLSVDEMELLVSSIGTLEDFLKNS
jgi:DNA-binding NarL/FixJ family response regulator